MKNLAAVALPILWLSAGALGCSSVVAAEAASTGGGGTGGTSTTTSSTASTGGAGGAPCTPVDDHDPCTDDQCENGAPVHTPRADGAVCGGGAACMVSATCQAGACVGGAPLCNGSATCVAGACVAPACAGALGLPGKPHASEAVSVAAADVDGDGKVDLVVANGDSDTVSVLRNLGNGAFAAPVGYPVGVGPSAVAAADLNGDGAPDLAVTNGVDGTVSVLLNKGDGTFAAAVAYGAGMAPWMVIAADLDGDGKADLAVVDSATVIVLRNVGGGAFAPAVDLSPALGLYLGIPPSAIAAADFDGDGKVDVAVSRPGGFNPGQVSVLWNQGNGTFADPIAVTTIFGPGVIAAADLDGDGKPDLAVGHGDADSGESGVSVLLNLGNRAFSPVGEYDDLSLELVRDVLAADFDGDGKTDLCVLRADDQVRVLRNDGGGVFTFEPTYDMGKNSIGGVAADLDGDGKPDLAVANRIETVHVLLNQGNDAFAALVAHPADPGPSPVRYPAGMGPWAVTAADLNGDGRPDLAVTSRDGGRVSVLLNHGDGTFAAPIGYGVGVEALAIAAADLNGDGMLDLAVANSQSGTVSVLLNQGDGTFAAAIDYAAGANLFALVAADLDGDGKPDLAVANYAAGTVSVLLNQGKGTFGAAVAYASGKGPTSIAAADLNGDGRPDLVVANLGGDDASVLLNQGGGAFAAAVHYLVDQTPTSIGPTAIAVADVDGDGKPDVVVETTEQAVAVLLGHGDGTFAPAVHQVGGGESLVLVDMNGDGRPDIVVGPGVVLNQGNGVFTGGAYYGTFDSTANVAAADFDGDGRPDLAVTNHDTDTVSVLINTCLP